MRFSGHDTLSVKEAAEFLDVKPRTLRAWSDAGKISCVRTPGNHRRFVVRQLEEFRDIHLSLNPIKSDDIVFK